MKVPLLDLKGQYAEIREEVMSAVEEVCASQYFILGPKVEQLESEMATYCGAGYSVGVSSGSDALIIALMAECVGPGDEVITTPFSFFATCGAIVRVGAKPVFVDIQPGTFNIDPELIEKKITPKTKAIIPVHLYGQCAEMGRIMEIAEKHNLIVIEDAAQAIGAEYEGQRAGSIGHYGCFSFFPSKNLGAFGDGGAVTTNDEEKYKLLKIFRNHGSEPKYYHKFIGGNFRLDALQAAILSVKLKKLDSWSAARQRNAAEYRSIFSSSPVAKQVQLPIKAEHSTRHVYNQFCILLPKGTRDTVKQGLLDAGVGVDVYYPVPLHMQECFSSLGHKKGDMPVSEDAAARIMALPIFPESTREQREYVVSTITDILQKI
ncbi:MAG: DegT/DnrJ/EryC1/StrS family aminotransferase [Victivallales bacterium]|nr:DegT/DnrJ/EryC1/StrS family aminotransferase [Victivallales bacterium]